MKNIFTLLIITLVLYSCKTKYYPASGNYVSKTNIKINGNYPIKEKNILLEKLEKQIDDSLTYRRERKLGLKFFPYFVKVYHDFDSNSISRTKDFFKAAYVANGYFRGGVTTHTIDSSKVDGNGKIINFTVTPFQNHKINNVELDFMDSSLQALATSIQSKTFIKKEDFYSQELLDAERKRIAAHFRNNGYLKFSKDDIKVIADTINVALLKIIDPFEQLELLAKADSFNRNPTTDITITLKDSTLKEKLKKYYVGNIILQPDNINEDTVPTFKQMIRNSSIQKQYFEDSYKNKLFIQNIYLKKGNLFKQEDLDKTIDALNYLGTWKQVIVNSLDSTIRQDTVDFKISMLPSLKYLREFKLDGSYNQNNNNNNPIPNLLGINGSFNLKNRNFRKEAIQTNTTFFSNIELGKGRIINTFQGGINYNLIFPKFIPKIKFQPDNKKSKFIQNTENRHSFLNTSISYSQRFKYFELAETSLSYGLQFKYKKDWNIQMGFLNIDNKVLKPLDSLDAILTRSPNLRFIYTDGLVVSLLKWNANREKINALKNKITSVRYNLEWSDLPFKINRLFSFVKMEYDRRYTWSLPKSQAFAVRIYGGIGASYKKYLIQNKNLPFFRQFVSGGPNNMRAWTLRSLNSYSTRSSTANITDYFGDIQAEINGEYRYKYGKIAGIPILGALFTDVGNIWNWTPYDKAAVPYNLSAVNRIYNDIAVAGGTSFRFDFEYFIIRFDLGMKLKDPTTINGDGGWFKRDNFTLSFNKLSNIKLQLGINYPF